MTEVLLQSSGMAFINSLYGVKCAVRIRVLSFNMNLSSCQVSISRFVNDKRNMSDKICYRLVEHKVLE